MVQNIEIKDVDWKSIKMPIQKEILEYVTKKVVEIFKKKVTKIYEINAPFLEGNYVPLEEMLGAISVDFYNNPVSCKKNSNSHLGLPSNIIGRKKSLNR